MKRFLIGALICLLCLCLALSAGAEEADVGEEQVPSETPGDTSVSETAADGEATSPGEYILGFFETYTGDIFSVLTFVGSLLLMYIYKRGFLPVLCRGLENISQRTEEMGLRAGELAEGTQGQVDAFYEKATPILERVEAICAGATALREQAAELEERLSEAEDDRARTQEMMRGVADLLYGVFSAANLPSYAKEQLGQRYAALTAVTSAPEATHESQDL